MTSVARYCILSSKYLLSVKPITTISPSNNKYSSILSCNKRDPFRLFGTNYYACHCWLLRICLWNLEIRQEVRTWSQTQRIEMYGFLPLCFHGREKNDNFLFWSYFSPMSVTVQASSMSFIFTHRCWTIFSGCCGRPIQGHRHYLYEVPQKTQGVKVFSLLIEIIQGWIVPF